MTISELYKKARDIGNEYPHDEFRIDAENAFEFAFMPKKVKDKIHVIAWEAGHSYGYHEVVSWYHDLVDLAKSFFKTEKIETQMAVEHFSKALLEDPDYYYAWQSNIAMAFKDCCARKGYKFPDLHEISNEAAKEFLSNLTKQV